MNATWRQQSRARGLWSSQLAHTQVGGGTGLLAPYWGSTQCLQHCHSNSSTKHSEFAVSTIWQPVNQARAVSVGWSAACCVRMPLSLAASTARWAKDPGKEGGGVILG
jgi:hypothetical protein